MEILPSGMRADYITNASHKEDYLGHTSNITKLHESELTQDASFFNKTFENAEITATQSWVDSAQQPPPNNITLEESPENNVVHERDQSQIKYLLSRLPILAEQFHLHRKVGEGTFSSVFLGTLKNSDPRSTHGLRQFAIKHLVPTTLPARTEKELQCLQDIGDYSRSSEQFHLHRKVGEGTFSSVFLGTLKNSDPRSTHGLRQFAIKYLVPTTLPARTEKELQCLQDIGGSDNVIGIDLCLRQSDCVVFIMPYLPHKRFSDYVQLMTMEETREYMLNLFIALRRVHSFNIIHRDIKPSNFLYDRENKKFLLVDFGLAQNVTTPEAMMSDTPSTDASHVKKRKREEEDKYSSHQETPVVQKSKRMALQPRTNENVLNISRNGTPNSHTSKPMKHSYWSSEAKKCPPENDIHQLGLSPSRNKILGTKNENTPPNNKKTPRHKLLQNEEIRSPLKDSRNTLKHNSIKKKLFSAGSPRVSNTIQTDGPKFQTLAPGTPKGACHVRVQNSQVKSHLVSPPMSTQQQKKLVFSRPSPVTQMHSKTSSSQQCHCYGKPKICNVCLVRKVQAAPRAGTPGFRPPEVLLKYPLQTTAVDMWAAGIILLCILSGCYPFFRSPDDLSALAEIMSVFGTEGIKNVAVKLGRLVTCSVEKKALNLRKLCERLRRHRKAGRPTPPPEAPMCPDCTQIIDIEDGCLCLFPGDNYEPSKREEPESQYPSSAYYLLERLLDLNPETRITATEALEHPFIKGL